MSVCIGFLRLLDPTRCNHTLRVFLWLTLAVQEGITLVLSHAHTHRPHSAPVGLLFFLKVLILLKIALTVSFLSPITDHVIFFPVCCPAMNFRNMAFMCCFIIPRWKKKCKQVCRYLNLVYSETNLVEMKCNALPEKKWRGKIWFSYEEYNNQLVKI